MEGRGKEKGKGREGKGKGEAYHCVSVPILGLIPGSQD